MAKDASVEYATIGHQDILASLKKRFRLNLVRTFSSDNTVCSLATTPTEEQVFIKVKGYKKNKANEGKFRRAVMSNRMAGKVKNNIMPRVLEFKTFERDDVLWLASLSDYGGEPMSRGLFFDGDAANVADHTLEQIRHALEVIPKTPSISFFYDPKSISEFIRKAFGEDVAFAASEWTSAHCDFHWGKYPGQRQTCHRLGNVLARPEGLRRSQHRLVLGQ